MASPDPAPHLAPADLRDKLLDAVARQDGEGLAALCERHQDEIRAAFISWKQIPDDVRGDPEAQTRYAQGLIAVAQLFERVGDGSLLTALMGGAADDPIAAWERALATARSLLEQGQSQEAADLLRSTLLRTGSLEGEEAVHLRPRSFGMLGVALFRAGDKTGGIEATLRAQTLCEEAGDVEGAAAYEGNLQRMTAVQQER